MAKAKDKIKFYLEKRKDADGNTIEKDVPIFLFYSFNGNRLQYYSGLRTDVSKWDEEIMRVDPKGREAKRINTTLDRLKRWVEEIADNAQALGYQLSVSEFRYKLKEKSGDTPKQKRSSNSFLDLMSEYIEESKQSKKPGTIKAIQTSHNNLIAFSDHAKIHLSFDRINQDFYNKLLDYCFKVREFKNNSAGRLIKDLKAFLNWATDKGLNSNMDYKKKSFKKLREEPEIIYLTYEELLHLYNLELDKVTHENVRNVFCFGAFTGMRFSDIAAMTRENIHKDKIEYRIAKTDEVNTIPINKYVKAILNKYKKDVKPLPVYSEQKTNLYLKELAVIAELNRKIKITHFRGGERLVKIEPLNELITFHVSKKTFMTNFLSRGGSLETAMAIVGNKDYKTAKRYYKVVDSLKADEMKRVFG